MSDSEFGVTKDEEKAVIDHSIFIFDIFFISFGVIFMCIEQVVLCVI